jgi:glyoxylase-like metal-dependent hydrolase (beta-lactamase superfamily II)
VIAALIIKKIIVGTLENNCYLIGDEGSGEIMLIDPGDEPDRILDLVEENRYKVKYIVFTHAHFDHVAAVTEIKEATEAQIVLHRDDMELYDNAQTQARVWGFEIDPLPKPDVMVAEGDQVEVGALRFQVLHTPGHSRGGICLFGEGVVVTGDTLFAGSVGRTDLHGGDLGQLKQSFSRLMRLPDITRVLPGHGPESTIGKEKTGNFFSSEAG